MINPKSNNMLKSNNNPNCPNALCPINPKFIISRKYVIGETNAIGEDSIGMKSGLIINRGNLTVIVRIIALDGWVEGGADKIILKQEKEKAATIIPRIIIIKFSDVHIEKITNPNINGAKVIIVANNDDAQISPNSIVLIEMGVVITLSRFLDNVSHGNVRGAIAVADIKSTMAIKPEII